MATGAVGAAEGASEGSSDIGDLCDNRSRANITIRAALWRRMRDALKAVRSSELRDAT